MIWERSGQRDARLPLGDEHAVGFESGELSWVDERFVFLTGQGNGLNVDALKLSYGFLVRNDGSDLDVVLLVCGVDGVHRSLDVGGERPGGQRIDGGVDLGFCCGLLLAQNAG